MRIDILSSLTYTLNPKNMPVTKTAKRALRGSGRKALINKQIILKLELAIRSAKKAKSKEKILAAISLADKAAKKRTIHKNKAARIKKALTLLLPKSKTVSSKKKK